MKITVLTAAALLALTPAAFAASETFSADLKPSAEVPAVDSKASGTITATYDTASKKLTYTATYKDLSGPATMAHFHGPAAPSQNANILVDISPAHSPLGSPKHGCVPFTKDQAKLLSKGLVYINVHSTMFTGGEIRGQVLPTKVKYTKVPAPASPSGAFLE